MEHAPGRKHLVWYACCDHTKFAATAGDCKRDCRFTWCTQFTPSIADLLHVCICGYVRFDRACDLHRSELSDGIMSSDDDFVTPAHIQRRKDIRRQRSSQQGTSSARSSKRSTQTPGTGKRQRTPTAAADRRQAKLSQPPSSQRVSSGTQPAEDPVQRCPVCGVDLSHISGTPLEQQQHVNACLDKAVCEPHGDRPLHPDPSPAAAEVQAAHQPMCSSGWRPGLQVRTPNTLPGGRRQQPDVAGSLQSAAPLQPLQQQQQQQQ